MPISAPKIYILAPKMYILEPKCTYKRLKWTKVYLLKRYRPSDRFCTFFSKSVLLSLSWVENVLIYMHCCLEETIKLLKRYPMWFYDCVYELFETLDMYSIEHILDISSNEKKLIKTGAVVIHELYCLSFFN